MGVRTPISTNCAMTLGGLKEGVTPLDMAHAYETFATGGNKITGSLGPEGAPVGIREVCRLKRGSLTDCAEDVDENKVKRTRVLPAEVADTATQILGTVVSNGTAVRARLDEFAAGKTGTTENYGDAWFVGFTKTDDGRGVGRLPGQAPRRCDRVPGSPVAGGTFPAEIWRDSWSPPNTSSTIAGRRARAQGPAAREDGDAERGRRCARHPTTPARRRPRRTSRRRRPRRGARAPDPRRRPRRRPPRRRRAPSRSGPRPAEPHAPPASPAGRALGQRPGGVARPGLRARGPLRPSGTAGRRPGCRAR
jgi:penicillin-binding protein 1A